MALVLAIVLILFTLSFPGRAAYRPTIPISYSFGETGPQLGAGALVGCTYNPAAFTVTGIVFTVHSYTCAVGPTVVLNDCGTSIGACSGTTLATVSPGGTGTTLGSTGAVVAAAHYICGVFSSGTCTEFGWSYTLSGSVNP